MELAPTEMSLLFQTSSANWPKVVRAIMGRGVRTSDLEAQVAARRGHLHADVEIVRSGRKVEWDIFVHSMPLDRRSAEPVSRRLGWLEGFGQWLAAIQGDQAVIGSVQCSATFALKRNEHRNLPDIPRKMAIAPLGNEQMVFSLGVQDSAGRWWIEAEPDSPEYSLGVGFRLTDISAANLFDAARATAVQRANDLVVSS